ncbi:MAG: endonuclease III [Bacteroidales bacterium]|nr:endonuclease III [Bacteroidales bacterium]
MTKSERRNLLFWLLDVFSRENPFPQTELHYKDAYQLTVAVILSAQCTDIRVNKITPLFFERFPDFKSLAKATVDEVVAYISSCSYPNNKARHLTALARMVMQKHEGKLPLEEKELLALPGIGRKSANVLLSILAQKNVLAVDTHVFRVAHRLGLVYNARTPEAVEKQIRELADDSFPLYKLHHWLILHGRYVCKSRKPRCTSCILKSRCHFFHTLLRSKDHT